MIYVNNELSPFHSKAREWWADLARQHVEVGLPWVVTIGFVRISTNVAMVKSPLALERAIANVDEWFRLPHVRPIDAGPKHWDTVRELLMDQGSSPRLTTDAHLAALAIEHRAQLATNDQDFRRFPKVKLLYPVG